MITSAGGKQLPFVGEKTVLDPVFLRFLVGRRGGEFGVWICRFAGESRSLRLKVGSGGSAVGYFRKIEIGAIVRRDLS